MITRDLGDAGPPEGPPILFRWSLWWNIAPHVGWLVLWPLMALKENRRRGACWIFAPVLIEIALVTWLDRAWLGGWLAVPGGSVIVAMAALLLLAERLPRRPAWRKGGAAALVWMGLSIPVLAFNSGASGFSSFMGEMLPVALAGLVFLLAWIMASRRCRAHPGVGRLALWLLLWVPVFMIAVVLALILVFTGGFWGRGDMQFLPVLLFGSALWGGGLGLVVWLILAPFLLLCSRHPVYGSRIRNIINPTHEPGEAP
ncbi:MAG: hypothetical protein KKC51_00535 [Verrucomicrobia bacterium]|nr:hypothetical protein [Verrucomicrobiota bacterium]